jgi:F420-dependent oxidoreductase-like protein
LLKANDDKIQFGLTIPQGWRGGDLPLEQENNPAKQFAFSKEIAITADKLNFDSIYAYDHLIPFFRDDTEKNIFECFTLLSAIAALTNKIRIGQIVTCNSYRNPAFLAKMLSTLDVISNGRSELGIGAGWYEKEYVAYGYDFPSNVTRIRQLEESISVIKELWTRRKATFSGRYYRIKEAICNPKPIQKPHPMIMVGGSGERYLLKVVAKHADRYNNFFGSPWDLKKKIGVLKEHCNTMKRDYKQIRHSVVLPCIITESEADVNKILSTYKRSDKTIKEYLDYLVGGITIGDPEKITKGLNEYIALGVTHFILHFIGLNNSALKLFKSKVVNKI